MKLGPLRKCNIHKYRHSRNHDSVWYWCRQRNPISDVEQEIWYDRQGRDSSIQMFELIDEDLTCIGVCGFTDIDHINQRAEFSFYLFPEYHHQKLAEPGLKTLFNHGFKWMNLHTIWGESMDKNHAIRVFEKIGMIKEGTRRDFYFRDGEFIDCHLYSIQRPNWKF